MYRKNVTTYITLPALIKERTIELDSFNICGIDYITVNLSVPSSVKCSDIYRAVPIGSGIIVKTYVMLVPVDEIIFPNIDDDMVRFPDWADSIVFIPRKYFDPTNLFSMYRLKIMGSYEGFVHCVCEKSGTQFYQETENLNYVDTIEKFEFMV